MATTSGPPVGLLANGAEFLAPEFYNAAGAQFAYGSLNDQMKDASGYYDAKGVWVPSGWSSGAGVFAGNNVPKYNGVAGGAGTPASFAGGFALQPANVGGSTAGYTAYGNQPFDPYKGRGNGNGGLLGPPGGGGGPPGSGGPPGGSAPPPGGSPGGIITTPPLPPNPPGGTIGGTPVPPRTRGNEPPNYNGAPPVNAGGLLNPGTIKTASGGQPGMPNTFSFPQNTTTTMKHPVTGKDVPNPFGLTPEQAYWALSGNPQAIKQLGTSLNAWNPDGSRNMDNFTKMSQIINYYEAAGGGFQEGGGYTAEDAARAARNYAASTLGKTASGQQLGEWIGDTSPEALAWYQANRGVVQGADGRWYFPQPIESAAYYGK